MLHDIMSHNYTDSQGARRPRVRGYDTAGNDRALLPPLMNC